MAARGRKEKRGRERGSSFGRNEVFTPKKKVGGDFFLLLLLLLLPRPLRFLGHNARWEGSDHQGCACLFGPKLGLSSEKEQKGRKESVNRSERSTFFSPFFLHFTPSLASSFRFNLTCSLYSPLDLFLGRFSPFVHPR